MEIEGLSYINDFITEAEEQVIVSAIDKGTWEMLIQRRIQQYGYTYSYLRHKIDEAVPYKPMPVWLQPIFEKITQLKLLTEIPDQLVINEYLPGQGIHPHIDSEICFTSYILIISLLSGCEMSFIHKRNAFHPKKLYFEPRSLLLLEGKSRYEWLHGINKTLFDKVSGMKMDRERRISLSFRKRIK